MRRTKASTTGQPRRAAAETTDLTPPATTTSLADPTRGRRSSAARTTAPDPLTAALRDAADLADTPAVKQWLRAMLHHGVACGGRVGLPRPLDSGGARP